jgi:predicted cupin superfamily sugar epimerase
MEENFCGPKPGQAHLLVYQHNMTLGNEEDKWQVGPYYKSPRTTKSEIWTDVDRPVYSNPYMLIQGNIIKPWVRMTKSDAMIFWHRGASLVVHAIDSKGKYTEQTLGDTLIDPNAKYSLRFEPNTWFAMELEQPDDENSFAFFSTVLVPGWKKEFMERGDEEAIVRLAGEEHREAIRRLMAKPDDNLPHEQDAHDLNQS